LERRATTRWQLRTRCASERRRVCVLRDYKRRAHIHHFGLHLGRQSRHHGRRQLRMRECQVSRAQLRRAIVRTLTWNSSAVARHQVFAVENPFARLPTQPRRSPRGTATLLHRCSLKGVLTSVTHLNRQGSAYRRLGPASWKKRELRSLLPPNSRISSAAASRCAKPLQALLIDHALYRHHHGRPDANSRGESGERRDPRFR